MTFLIAAVKALLVALYYMHLKFERRVIYAMALVPVVLVAVLTFLLFPTSSSTTTSPPKRLHLAYARCVGTGFTPARLNPRPHLPPKRP